MGKPKEILPALIQEQNKTTTNNW